MARPDTRRRRQGKATEKYGAAVIQATLILANGETNSITLPDDVNARLRQLQALVGGYIEVVPLPGYRYMAINENGKDGPHFINQTATMLAHEAESIMASDYIAGDAVILPSELIR